MGSSPYFRQLFQIGDVVGHFHIEQTADASYTSLGNSQQLTDSYKILSAVSNRISTIRTETYKMLAFKNGLFDINRLLNLLGNRVDVIAYEYVNKPQHYKSNCSCASCGCCPCDLLWLHSTGVVKSISIREEDFEKFYVDLTIEYDNYWKALNRVLWKASNEYFPTTFTKQLPETWLWYKMVHPYPSCDDITSGRCWSFHKLNYENNNWLYDPLYYPDIHCHHRNNYPATGSFSYWTVGNDIVTNLFVDTRYWNAPALSTYLLKDFNIAGENLTIEISNNTGGRLYNYTTTVDYDSLLDIYDERSQTYDSDDILIFGDVKGQAYIRRDSELLFYCGEAITRTYGEFPAILYGGYNMIKINTNEAALAQHHYYRRL